MREVLDLIVAELRGAWRFRWIAIAMAWLVCVGGWVVVYAMPDTYESEATVLFDTTSDLDELLESLTVNSDVLSRVETVQTALLGRPQLEKVARETDLYLRARDGQSMDQLISGLRSRITINSDRQRGANVYRLAYRDENPQMAFSVVSTLLNNFVEETLGANRAGTQRAQKFLRDEIAVLESDLTESEDRLAAFKRENVGRMPGEQGDYFQRLQAEMDALENTQSNLRQAKRQRDTLQQQLAGEAPTSESGAAQSELDARITENERRLAELQLRFTDRHPDVIAVKATLDELRDQKAQQVEELRQSGGVGVVSDNPVFQNIQIELARVNVEIASLEEQVSTHERKIAEYERLVNVLPQIEAELARLNRDYDVKQAQYKALLQRLEIAELSESAEQSEDVKFQVIDPPVTPTKPAAPNRPMLLAFVLVIGLGAGGGGAFLGNQIKPVFTDPKTIRQVVGLPVLGTVQTMNTRDRRKRRAGQITAFSVAIGGLCVVSVLVILFHEPAVKLIRTII